MNLYRTVPFAGVTFMTLLFLLVFTTWAVLPALEMNRFEAISPSVVDRNGDLVHVFLSEDDSYRLLTRPEDIDPRYLEALLAFEDQRFEFHPGVDPLALIRAAGQLVSHGEVISGGSTITMQVARLLEPKPRTLLSKWIEIVRAFELELRFSKQQILTMYLTMVPMGGNLEGVRAATLKFWEIEPDFLSLPELALLLSVPQSPESRRPDRASDELKKAVSRTAQRLVDAEVFTVSDMSLLGMSRELSNQGLPKFAWHASREVVNGPVYDPSSGEWRSTLDLQLQKNAENIVRQFSDTFQDGESVALLVVDAQTGDVHAHLSGTGFDEPGGYLDLSRAWRSPGSTLKPFIYGMAFDDRLLDSQTILLDAPKSFGGYAPSNFDRKFRGPVRAGHALKDSLNVPAVQVLEYLGTDVFLQAWSDAGLSLRLPRSDNPGLGLALGTGAASLRQLAMAYASLANGGYAMPLRSNVNSSHEKQHYLLTGETSNTLRQILALPESGKQGVASFSAKTGTSYGFRDSWAVGVKGGYVIGTWVGRPDGNSVAGNIGRDVALRLAQRVASVVESTGEVVAWRAQPVTAEDVSDSRFELVYPTDGSQVLLQQRPDPQRQLMLKTSGETANATMHLNDQRVEFGSNGAISIPIPYDGHYELKIREAGRPVRMLRFAIITS